MTCVWLHWRARHWRSESPSWEMARFLFQQKQCQNLLREKIQKAQTCLNVCLPQTAPSNLNIPSASGQQPRSRTQLQELPLCHTQCPLPVCVPVTKTSWKMTTRQKPHLLLILAHTGDSEGMRNYAARFRLQVAAISSSYTSLSRDSCSSLDSKPFVIHTAKKPACQTGVDFFCSVYQWG